MVQTETPLFARHLAPILTAVRTKGLRSLILLAHTPAVHELATLRAPAVVIVGDDLEVSEGPAAFHRGTLRAVLGRATHCAVMAGEAVPTIYATAVTAALMFRGVVVLIECSERTEVDWLAAMERWARRASKLMVTPVPDGVRVQ